VFTFTPPNRSVVVNNVDVGNVDFASTLDNTPPSNPANVNAQLDLSRRILFILLGQRLLTRSQDSRIRIPIGTNPAYNPGDLLFLDWTDDGITGTTVNIGNLVLEYGEHYYVYVRAINGAGVKSDEGVSTL